jgi:hypothetical protein
MVGFAREDELLSDRFDATHPTPCTAATHLLLNHAPLQVKLVAENNAAHGEGKWLAVYGGDNANAAKPDIGAVMQLVGRLGGHVLAVQCKHYAGLVTQT